MLAESSKRPAARGKKRPTQNFRKHLLLGAVLLVLGLWILAAFFTVQACGLGSNWLGPFLGGVLYSGVLSFFGHGSILLFAASLLVFAAFSFSKFSRLALLRLACGFFLLAICASYMVSLRSYGEEVTGEVANYGGILGRALSGELAFLFGESVVVPAVCGVVFLLAVLAACFGLRLKHFNFLAGAFSKIFGKGRPREPAAPEPARPALKPSAKKMPELFDDTIIPATSKPFKASGAWASDLGTLSFNEPVGDDADGGDASVHRIEYLEAYLRQNGERMDDMEKRRIRDELAELRRVRQMNEWEDANEERPAVQGALRGQPLEGFTESAEPEVQEEEPLDEVAEEPDGEEVPKPDLFEEPDTIPEVPVVYEEYQIPRAEDILDEQPPQEPDYTEEELQEIAHQLEMNLDSYKVKGRVTNIVTGPVITRFEVEPGPGIKVSRFSALQDDLALALKARSIRILAPIPGKSVVGMEVPNRKSHVIFCREIFDSEHFVSDPNKLQIVLGKDITGTPFTMDLARAPHLLIAGQTGSGKSVCINVLMASLLLSKTPDELRMILVDPKVVELKMYESIPHLLAPVVTQPEVAVQALKWTCVEMDRRYEVLAKVRARNLQGFNEKISSGNYPDDLPESERCRLPFIVVIIDELADLMMVAGKEVETSIARIAQKARAVGIHLVLATQRPSSNVITGVIKANLPTRIAFKVSSAVDSRIIIDSQGAERLLGRGDMLYRAGDSPEPCRVHGAFLTDDEAERLATACADQNVDYPQLDTFEIESEDEEEDDDKPAPLKLDKKFWDVALWAAEMGRISTSAVQRSFEMGFSRASRLVDQMERLGICGKDKGNSKPRDILMTSEEVASLMERWT